MSMKTRDRSRKGQRLSLRRQEGFGLVEVLIAIMILGVVAVGFLSALSTSYAGLALAGRHSRAESLIRTEFEFIRGLPYSANLNLPAVAFPDSWNPDAQYGYPPDYPGYRVGVTSSVLLADNSTSPVKQVAVVVLFQSVLVDNVTSYVVNPNKNF